MAISLEQPGTVLIQQLMFLYKRNLLSLQPLENLAHEYEKDPLVK